MSSREVRIGALNDAIESLNEDAEGMHDLISRSITGLDSATDASNKAADNAAKLIEALAPLSETLSAQYRDTSTLVEEARKATENQSTAIAGQIESLKSSVDEALESVRLETHSACSDLKAASEESYAELGKATENQSTAIAGQIESLKSSVDETLASVRSETQSACSDLKMAAEESFGNLREAQDESFGEFTSKSLKEQQRTRDELQTDILGFKNATSARLDSLEAEMAKLTAAVKELGDKTAENTDAAKRKLIVPIYIAIGIGVANLACLLMLLLR